MGVWRSLAQMYKPKKVTHATLEFLDLPGLNFAEEVRPATRPAASSPRPARPT